jgi:hypothetical protein
LGDTFCTADMRRESREGRFALICI